MVGLQYGFGIAASQTSVAVTLAKLSELLEREVSTTVVPRSSPLAKIVGLGLPDFLGVIFGPLLTASYYFVALAFIVIKFVSGYDLLVVRFPLRLVLGYLYFMLFLVLSTCLDPMGKARSSSLILSVLLQAFTTILSYAQPDTHLALVQMAICHPKMFVEICKILFDSTTPADLRAHLTRYLGL